MLIKHNYTKYSRECKLLYAKIPILVIAPILHAVAHEKRFAGDLG